MTDAFDVLSADHAEVKQMLAELEGGPRLLTGATEALLEARGKLAAQLIIESSKHEAVEEQYFWPAVRDRLENGDELADHAIGQEAEAKHVLARLEKLAPSDAEFDDLLTEFIPAARAHITFEETRVWPALRQALGQSDAVELGKKLTDAKKLAPTRPHPAMPASPATLKAAGPTVAATDKLRDAVTGRGSE